MFVKVTKELLNSLEKNRFYNAITLLGNHWESKPMNVRILYNSKDEDENIGMVSDSLLENVIMVDPEPIPTKAHWVIADFLDWNRFILMKKGCYVNAIARHESSEGYSMMALKITDRGFQDSITGGVISDISSICTEEIALVDEGGIWIDQVN